MSWYQDKAYNIISSGNASYNRGVRMPYRSRGRDMSFTLTITDMNSEEDYEAISESLLSLEGVNSVYPVNREKKIVVNFNTGSIGLESIAYAIAKLGYHYLQRG